MPTGGACRRRSRRRSSAAAAAAARSSGGCSMRLGRLPNAAETASVAAASNEGLGGFGRDAGVQRLELAGGTGGGRVARPVT